MHLQEIFDLTLTQGQGHIKHCHLHHVTYVPAKLEVALAIDLGDALPRKYIIWPWPQGQGDQGHTNIAQYPRLYVTYAPANFDVATSHG